MILRNQSSSPQTFNDGPEVKSVQPQQLVKVSAETGMLLLTQLPRVWIAEAALIPPPPPSAP
jgi:hypothetical protein